MAKIRIKGVDTKDSIEVPSASRRRNAPVSSLKARVDTVDQKKALRPNAARGKAVAVPR
jgi:hypothetical protein